MNHKVSQWYEVFYHDSEVMDLNPSRVEFRGAQSFCKS